MAEGHAVVPVGRTYRLDQIVDAHTDIESGAFVGQTIVVV